MKKIMTFLLFMLISGSALAYDYGAPVTNEIKDTQSVVYNSLTKEWFRVDENNTKDAPTPDEVVFTKYITKGSGGYSEYDTVDKQYEAGEGSTYEFLDGTELIAYNAHTLKFYKLDFDGEKITAKELTVDRVQKYFPDVKIVKISQFKNNKIELTKKWFKPKSFMLLNDTKTDFYKYQFENIKSYQLIKGMFEIPKNQIRQKPLVFSHFSSKDKMYPVFQIVVKNSFKG